MTGAIYVERMHGNIYIYDKLGGQGHIELTEKEAEIVREKLEDLL